MFKFCPEEGLQENHNKFRWDIAWLVGTCPQCASWCLPPDSHLLLRIFMTLLRVQIAWGLCLFLYKSASQYTTCLTRKLWGSIDSHNALQDNQIKDARQVYDDVIAPWKSPLFLVGTIFLFLCLILISLSPWATVYCSVSKLRPKTLCK